MKVKNRLKWFVQLRRQRKQLTAINNAFKAGLYPINFYKDGIIAGSAYIRTKSGLIYGTYVPPNEQTPPEGYDISRRVANDLAMQELLTGYKIDFKNTPSYANISQPEGNTPETPGPDNGGHE